MYGVVIGFKWMSCVHQLLRTVYALSHKRGKMYQMVIKYTKCPKILQWLYKVYKNFRPRVFQNVQIGIFDMQIYHLAALIPKHLLSKYLSFILVPTLTL
jgi:hypothetical protein